MAAGGSSDTVPYTYGIDDALVGSYDDVRRISYGSDAATDVGVENCSHQDRYRVQFHHLTQPAP
jgi:hypothetical protein